MAFADDWRENPLYQQRMQYYAPMVQQAVQQYNLPPEAAQYLQGVLGVESKWGTAKGLSTPGAAGELGIAQLTPGFRKDYGVTNPLDEQQSIDAAARYFAQQYQRGVPLEYIPIGYNAGTGTLNKFMSGERSFEQLPIITQNYVNRLRQFTGRSAGTPSTGLANFSTPVSRTLNQYGLNTQKATQAPADFASALYGGGGQTGFGTALLGNTGGRVSAPRTTTTRTADEFQPVPMFQAGASLEDINRLLQGV